MRRAEGHRAMSRLWARIRRSRAAFRSRQLALTGYASRPIRQALISHCIFHRGSVAGMIKEWMLGRRQKFHELVILGGKALMARAILLIDMLTSLRRNRVDAVACQRVRYERSRSQIDTRPNVLAPAIDSLSRCATRGCCQTG